jgi:aryl-alcohol dehydrogenase-like predicted oxidoreductase
MRYEMLGGVGRKASVICLGSGDFGGSTPEEHAFEIMDKYYDHGGNFIDTARVYGDFASYAEGGSEQCIGKWMRQRDNRDKIIIATKGGCHHFAHFNASMRRLDRASLTEDLNLSLEALGVDKIDLYWLHRDDIYRYIGDILETLNGFVEQGLITAFGASNWCVKRLRAADAYAAEHKIKGFAADQIRWSLIHQVRDIDDDAEQLDEGIYAYHKWSKIPLMPYSSQARGYINKLEKDDPLPHWTQNIFDDERNRKIYETLCQMRGQTGISASALQLAYLMDRPFPVFPIIYASKPHQLDDALEGADVVMPPDDKAMLDALVRELFGTI